MKLDENAAKTDRCRMCGLSAQCVPGAEAPLPRGRGLSRAPVPLEPDAFPLFAFSVNNRRSFLVCVAPSPLSHCDRTLLGGGTHRAALVIFGSVQGCSEFRAGLFAAGPRVFRRTGFRTQASVLEGTALSTCRVLAPSPEARRSCPGAPSQGGFPAVKSVTCALPAACCVPAGDVAVSRRDHILTLARPRDRADP